MKIKQILRIISRKNGLNYILDRLGIKKMDDIKFIKYRYNLLLKEDLNLVNPQKFNEKLQWLKLYDRNPKYTKMVDKYEAKKYVASLIGNEYIIPTLGIYNSWKEIDFNQLPNQFVIKCTHDSGGIAICKDKETFDFISAKKMIEKSQKHNFYYQSREWPYKNVKPRIIIEKYMEDKNSKSMRDYKFFCFNGNPKIMYISEGLENHETASMSFYDMDFNLTSCKRTDFKLLNYVPTKPVNFEKMKEYSKILSCNIPHVRVDWYEINGKLYFGELTFYTCSGMIPFENKEWDYTLGSWIHLEEVEKHEK